MNAADMQSRRDAEYRASYKQWLASLPDAERKRVDRLGLGKPDIARRTSSRGSSDALQHAAELVAAPDAQPGEDDDHDSSRPGDAIVTDLFTPQEVASILRDYMRWLILGEDPLPGASSSRAKRTGEGKNRTAERVIARDTIARRALAAGWVMDAGLFEGRSLNEVGRLPRVDFTGFSLAKQARAFSETFGVRSRGMKTVTACEAYSRAARRRWGKQATRSPVTPTSNN